MGFFADPAAASIKQEAVFGGYAFEGADIVAAAAAFVNPDDDIVSSPQGRRKSRSIRRSVSMESSGHHQVTDSSSDSKNNNNDSSASPLKQQRRRQSGRKQIRRSKSNDGVSPANISMQDHLEQIEAFCRLMKDAGTKERTKMLRKSIKVQQLKHGKEGSST